MEIIICLLLIAVVIELSFILYFIANKEAEKEVQDRRKTYGVFANPLADKYRKNTDGLYRPIKPYKGDEEDEV